LKRLILNIVDDTLKREKNGVRRFSTTKLTMFSAWLITVSMAIDHHCKNGFNYSVWIAFLGVATGMKIADKISKKIQPKNSQE